MIVLQFKPVAPLEILFTESSLAKYQSIFAFLLKLVRADEALSRISLSKSWKLKEKKKRKFIEFTDHEIEMIYGLKHKMTAFLKGLQTYALFVGVHGVYSEFQACVAAFLDQSSEYHTISELDRLHQGALDRIHYRLFLRHKQEPVLKLVFGLLQLILDFSRRVCSVYSERTADFSELAAKWTQLHLMFVKIFKSRIEADQSKGHLGVDKRDLPDVDRWKRGDVAAFETLLSLCA
jgi:hypothetical protein